MSEEFYCLHHTGKDIPFLPLVKIIIAGYENKSKDIEQLLSLVPHFRHLLEMHDKQLNRSSSEMEKTNTP